MSRIPTTSRLRVKERENNQCARCGGRGAEWHHRRTRRVLDEHTHCSCNGVWLCRTCHRWAHANPIAAKGTGFVVSRHEPEPSNIPLRTYRGVVRLTCEGQYTEHGE